jgi:outer membrane protein TolC
MRRRVRIAICLSLLTIALMASLRYLYAPSNTPVEDSDSRDPRLVVLQAAPAVERANASVGSSSPEPSPSSEAPATTARSKPHIENPYYDPSETAVVKRLPQREVVAPFRPGEAADSAARESLWPDNDSDSLSRTPAPARGASQQNILSAQGFPARDDFSSPERGPIAGWPASSLSSTAAAPPVSRTPPVQEVVGWPSFVTASSPRRRTPVTGWPVTGWPSLATSSNTNLQPTREQLPDRVDGDASDAQPPRKYLTLEQLSSAIASTSVLENRSRMPMGVNDAVARALLHSKQLHIQRLLPQIEEQRIGEALGNFDWFVFVNNLLRDSAQRIESPENFNDSFQGRFQSRVGIRKNTRTGGMLEISERLRALDGDDGLLSTDPRAHSQLRLRFSQELLRDSGRFVTESEVLIASLMTEFQSADSLAEMTNVLLMVSDVYWQLYRARGEMVVQAKLLESAQRVVIEMRARRDLDVEDSLLAQATAAVFNRQRDLALARAEVKQLQDLLQRLVNDPTLDSNIAELLTTEPAFLRPIDVNPDAALAIAFQTRPEVRAALKRIEIADVDRQVAINQLLPRMTLILEAQFSGTDRGGLSSSLLSSNDDSVYGAMLNFEYPLWWNRQARSQQRRTELELMREQREFEDVVEQVAFDVKEALRILEGNAMAVDFTRQSVDESLKELAYRETRMKIAPRQNANSSVTLDQLLRAQRRLGEAQLAHLEAIVDYNQALMQLRRATGELVEVVQGH